MSECEKIKRIIESVANGECSKADKALLDAHVLECSECREELSFVMGINETLHSLPKMEVPDDFLVSLNKRLDVEDKIKACASRRSKRKVFQSWQKYSALTACLLLAVLVQINVWDLPVNNDKNDVVVQVEDKNEPKKNSGKPEKTKENKEKTVEETSETDVAENDNDITDTVTVSNNDSEVEEKPTKENSTKKAPKTQSSSNKQTSENKKTGSKGTEQKKTEDVNGEVGTKTNSQKKEAQQHNNVKSESASIQSQTAMSGVETNKQNTTDKAAETTNVINQETNKQYNAVTSEKSVVVTTKPQKTENKEVVKVETEIASKPQSSDSKELPGYMDNKDNIIIVPEGAKRVDFDDYEIVVTEEFLEAFSMAEMPSNNVIVASPAAMASIENISMDTNSACPVPETNYGAGSGSLLVAASDVQKVQSILNKYSTGAQNQTFMLTSSNYNSFINELEGEGIEYHDYMIHAGKSNVAFTLIAS